jgi:MFS family permease
VDKHGRRKSARIGSLLAAIASLLYILFPSFLGVLVAGLVLATGYSFLSGSMAALIHDSLLALGREDEFAKVASRAQSLSLVVNAGIIATVPLLYPIDKRLPYVVGLLAFTVLFLIASLLTEPPFRHSASNEEKKFIYAIRHLLNRSTAWLFLSIGFLYSMTQAPVDLYNLSYNALGLQPKYYGFMYGAASLIAAAVGYGVHHLKRLTLKQFATLDLSTTLFLFIAIGFARSLPLTIAAFLINMTLFRYQRIMYSHYLLQIFGSTRYKATLLSLAVNFGQLHELWLGLSFTRLAQHVGILNSFYYLSAFVLVAWFFLIFSLSHFATKSAASSSVATQ